MFLDLKRKQLHIYEAARELIKEIYNVSSLLPADEKFNTVQQIRRAALSVKLNIAEGSTRHSEQERKRYIEIARGSIVELDAALETAIDVNYLNIEQLKKAGELLNKCFAMLSRMMHRSTAMFHF